MVWSVGVPNPCKFYKNTEQVQGRESFEVGVGGLGRPLWGGPNWAQCWMKVGASQAVTWVRCCPGSWEWETEGKVRGRGADTRWCLPEQPQRGMAGSVGHLQGGWLEPHVSEQTRVPSISFVFCHIYGISLAFCHIAGKKKGMYLKGWGGGSI